MISTATITGMPLIYGATPVMGSTTTATTSTTTTPTAHVIEMKNGLSPLTVVAVPTLPLSVLNGATPSVANPCLANVTDKLLTMAMVEIQYPAMKWGNSEPWTAQEMQCWAWLSQVSQEVHPARQFTKQYGFEPFLLQL